MLNLKEENSIYTSIRTLDTLRQSYNVKIRKETTVSANKGLSPKAPVIERQAPELELHEKMIELQKSTPKIIKENGQ